jgi:hypothetical protein
MYFTNASCAEQAKSDSHFYLPGFGTNEPNNDLYGIFIPFSEGDVKPPVLHNSENHHAISACPEFAETSLFYSNRFTVFPMMR